MYRNYPGVLAGAFAAQPRGAMLHGSRSGLARATSDEFFSTARYAVHEPNGYGWNVTVGDDAYAVHLPIHQWGWHARGCSPLYLSAEFAQGTERDGISDGQVRAFCHWYLHEAINIFPLLVRNFPTHAEVDGTAEYGGTYDGKTDVFSRGDPRTVHLRARINARLDDFGKGWV